MPQGLVHFQEPQEVQEKARGGQGHLGTSHRQASLALSSAGPKMVAVQNYLGNPAPGKPVLTLPRRAMWDRELLRGDPESQWWEVGPGRISHPSAPSSLPRAEVESAAFPGRGGFAVLDHQREDGCSQGLGARVFALTWHGEQRPSPERPLSGKPSPPRPPAWAVSCTPLPPCFPARPVQASTTCPALGGQHVRGPAQPSPRRHSPRDGLWFWGRESCCSGVRGLRRGVGDQRGLSPEPPPRGP